MNRNIERICIEVMKELDISPTDSLIRDFRRTLDFRTFYSDKVIKAMARCYFSRLVENES